jgi:hypothetical protein
MSNLQKAVECYGKTKADEEIKDPTMEMIIAIALTLQDKIKQSCNNEPFEDWPYEKVKALFFKKKE